VRCRRRPPPVIRLPARRRPRQRLEITPLRAPHRPITRQRHPRLAKDIGVASRRVGRHSGATAQRAQFNGLRRGPHPNKRRSLDIRAGADSLRGPRLQIRAQGSCQRPRHSRRPTRRRPSIFQPALWAAVSVREPITRGLSLKARRSPSRSGPCVLTPVFCCSRRWSPALRNELQSRPAQM